MDKKSMLEQLINYYANGNKTHFSKLLGVTPQGVSTWLSRGTIDYELVYSKCDGLNAHWLLTGEGSMLCNEQAHATPISTTQITQPALPVEESFLYKMYKEKDEENKALIRENGHLEERVRMLESKLSDCSNPDALKVQELVLELPETARPAATKQHLSTSEPSASYAGSPLQKQ